MSEHPHHAVERLKVGDRVQLEGVVSLVCESGSVNVVLPQQSGRHTVEQVALSIPAAALTAQQTATAVSREEIETVLVKIEARAKDALATARTIAETTDAAAAHLDPARIRSVHAMGAKHDWLMEAVTEIRAVLSLLSGGKA